MSGKGKNSKNGNRVDQNERDIFFVRRFPSTKLRGNAAIYDLPGSNDSIIADMIAI